MSDRVGRPGTADAGLEIQAPRPLAGGAAMSATGRIAVTGAGAATTIVLARLLGPQGWGTFSIASLFFSFSPRPRPSVSKAVSCTS